MLDVLAADVLEGVGEALVALLGVRVAAFEPAVDGSWLRGGAVGRGSETATARTRAAAPRPPLATHHCLREPPSTAARTRGPQDGPPPDSGSSPDNNSTPQGRGPRSNAAGHLSTRSVACGPPPVCLRNRAGPTGRTPGPVVYPRTGGDGQCSLFQARSPFPAKAVEKGLARARDTERRPATRGKGLHGPPLLPTAFLGD